MTFLIYLTANIKHHHIQIINAILPLKTALAETSLVITSVSPMQHRSVYIYVYI